MFFLVRSMTSPCEMPSFPFGVHNPRKCPHFMDSVQTSPSFAPSVLKIIRYPKLSGKVALEGAAIMEPTL